VWIEEGFLVFSPVKSAWELGANSISDATMEIYRKFLGLESEPTLLL